tara:strand:- start:84 stop:224 length:141 start_codon:yes stop_codon:yes gene_type:complete
MINDSNKHKKKNFLQQFVNFLTRIFFLKQKKTKEKKNKTDDIYPLW